MADLASVYQIIGEDLLSPAAESAGRSIEGLNQKAGIAGTAIGALGTAFAAAGVAVAGGLAASVSLAANFEQAISNIGAVAGASAEQMRQISDTALQLGKDTSFSATEAAAGMEELLKAGVSIGDVIGGGARAALDLAAAGGLSVAEAATIASNAMNVFSQSGDQAGHVADVIAGAANASAIDVHDFGFSLSAAGAVAATVGLSFEDTATAIAVLGQAGLKGSDAGTSLKTMLLNLSPTSNRAKDEMRALGIITEDGANKFFDAEGKVKSFDQVAQILQDSMQGLTKEQQINALQTAFGTDAIRAAAIMAKAGAAGFTEMADAMSHVTAQDVAAKRLDNLKGSLEALSGSLETAGIMLGSVLLPGLTAMTRSLTTSVNEAIGILELLPAAVEDIAARFNGQATNGAGDALLTALGLGPDSIALVNSTIQQIGDAWRTVGQVFEGDWSPDDSIDPVVNAIGMIATVVRDQVIPAFQAAGQFIAANAATITGALVGVGAVLTAIWAGSAIVGGIAAVGAAIAFLVSPIGLVIAAAALLGAAWVNDWGGIQEKTAAVIGWFTANLPLIEQTTQTVISAVSALWGTFGGDILTILSAAWTIIDNTLTTQVTDFGLILVAGMQVINGDWSGALSSMTTVLQNETALWISNISTMATTAQTLIDGWTGGGLTSIETWATTTAGDIATWATTTAGSISTWVTETGTAISTWVTTALATLSTWGTTALTTLATWGTDAATAVTLAIDGVNLAFTAGWALIEAAWTAGWALLGTIQTAAWNLLTPENQAKVLELETLIGTLWTTLGTLWTTGTAAVTTLVTTWWGAISTLWTTQSAAVSTQTSTWWTAAGALWTTGTAAVTTTVSAWWLALTNLWTTSTLAITAILQPWLTAAAALWVTMETAVTTAATTWWGSLSTLWTTSVTALTTTLTTEGGKWAAVVTTALAAIGTAISGAVTSFTQAATALGTSIVTSIIAGINTSIGGIASALIAGVRGAISSASGLIPGMGGGGGAGGGSGLPGAALTSYQPTSGEANARLARAGQIGMESGLNPEGVQALQAVLKTEGGLFGAVNTSDPGGSYGPYQLNAQGQLKGFAQWLQQQGIQGDPKQLANDVDLSSRYATQGYLGNTIRQGQAQGIHGAALATYAQQYGQVSVDPWKAGQNFGPLITAPGAGTPSLQDMQKIPVGPNPLGDAGLMGSRWNPADMQGIIDLAPPWERAMADIKTSGQDAFTGVLTSSTDMGNGVTLTITQTGTTAVATMRDAGGQITGQWSSDVAAVTTEAQTLAVDVPAATEAMRAQALVSVTNLGSGMLTTITDTAGNTTATVTDMAGNVTSQYATMANGAQLSANEMGTGTLTSVNNMGTGVITSVTDMSGNMLTTITDMSGNVVTQYATMASGATTQTDVMVAGVATSTAAMSENWSTDMTDIGTNVGQAFSTILSTTTTDADQMNNNVSGSADAMNLRTQSAALDMSSKVGDSVGGMVGAVVTLADGMNVSVSGSADDMNQSASGSAADMETNVGGSATNMSQVVGDALGALTEPLANTATGMDGVGTSADGATGPVGDLSAGLDDAGAAGKTATPPVKDFAGASASIKPPSLSKFKSDLDDVADSAKNAAKQLVAVAGATNLSKGANVKGIGGKAGGGPVFSDSMYIVGEKGPELFVPSQSGVIIPNNRLRGLAAGGAVSVSGSPLASIGGDAVPVTVDGDTRAILQGISDRADQLVTRGADLTAALAALGETVGTSVSAAGAKLTDASVAVSQHVIENGKVEATGVSLLQGLVTALTRTVSPSPARPTTGTTPTPAPVGGVAAPAPGHAKPTAPLPAGYEYKEFSPGVWGVQPAGAPVGLATPITSQGPSDIGTGAHIGPVVAEPGIAPNLPLPPPEPQHGQGVTPGLASRQPEPGIVGVNGPQYGQAVTPGLASRQPEPSTAPPGAGVLHGQAATTAITAPIAAADASVKKLSVSVTANTTAMQTASVTQAKNMADRVARSSDLMRNDVGTDVADMTSTTTDNVSTMSGDVVTAADLMREGAINAADLMRGGVITQSGLMQEGATLATQKMHTDSVGSDGWITRLKVDGVRLAGDLNTGVVLSANALDMNLNDPTHGSLTSTYSRGVHNIDNLRNESIDLIGGSRTDGMVVGITSAAGTLYKNLNGPTGQLYLVYSDGVTNLDKLRNEGIALADKAKVGITGSFGAVKSSADLLPIAYVAVKTAGDTLAEHPLDPSKWVTAIGKIESAAKDAKTAIDKIPNAPSTRASGDLFTAAVPSDLSSRPVTLEPSAEFAQVIARELATALRNNDPAHPVNLSLTLTAETQDLVIQDAQAISAI